MHLSEFKNPEVILLFVGTILVVSLVPSVSAEYQYFNLRTNGPFIHAGGPGWNLTVDESLMVDPATGQPYPNEAAFTMVAFPEAWNNMSAEQKKAESLVPARGGGFEFSLHYGQAQWDLERPLRGIPMTEAEFYQRVWPDMYAAAPQWVRDMWAAEPHHWSESVDSNNPVYNLLTTESKGVLTDFAPLPVSTPSVSQPLTVFAHSADISGQSLSSTWQNPDRLLAPSGTNAGTGQFAAPGWKPLSVLMPSQQTQAGGFGRESYPGAGFAGGLSTAGAGFGTWLDYDQSVSASGTIDNFGFGASFGS